MCEINTLKLSKNNILVQTSLFRPRYGSKSSDRGSSVPCEISGLHPAGVRGTAHQGHQDDAGGGGGVEDQGNLGELVGGNSYLVVRSKFFL